MNPHNSIEETQSEEKKCPGCGEPGCLCWKELLKEQDEELHTCHSLQSVQKEELWQEFKKKYKGVYWNEDDRLWLDSIVDRISASVREETEKKVEREYYQSVQIGTMDIQIRIRDKGGDNVEQLRFVIAKEEIEQSKGKILRLVWEDCFAKFAVGSKIFKEWSGLSALQKLSD